MGTTTAIDKLTAAQLSDAAYIPLATYAANQAAGLPTPGVPAGWQVDILHSGNNSNSANPISTNQFITFVNNTGPTTLVMITFKRLKGPGSH